MTLFPHLLALLFHRFLALLSLHIFALPLIFSIHLKLELLPFLHLLDFAFLLQLVEFIPFHFQPLQFIQFLH